MKIYLRYSQNCQVQTSFLWQLYELQLQAGEIIIGYAVIHMMAVLKKMWVLSLKLKTCYKKIIF